MIFADINTAALFAIPQADWLEINRRVGMTLLSRSTPLRFEPPRFPTTIPDFPFNGGFAELVVRDADTATAIDQAYVAVWRWHLQCHNWTVASFPEIISAANELAAYSASAVDDFIALNNSVEALPTGSDVPAALKNQTVQLIEKLTLSTTNYIASFNNVSANIEIFLAAYIDAKNKYVKGLKPHSGYLGFLDVFGPGDYLVLNPTPSRNMITCLQLIRGTWSAIADDLKRLVSEPLIVDLPFLLSLNLKAAIDSWSNVHAEAAAFPLTAGSTTQYWTKYMEPSGGDWS